VIRGRSVFLDPVEIDGCGADVLDSDKVRGNLVDFSLETDVERRHVDFGTTVEGCDDIVLGSVVGFF
jgi:hypothetical protein